MIGYQARELTHSTPLVQRVWTILEEKSIPYQYIEVNPYHKPASLLKLNPRGLVPTLEFEGKPLYESTVIGEFLEEQYPDHDSKLLPPDAFERARMRIWIDFVTTRIIASFHRYLQFQPGQSSGTLEDVRNEYLDNLKQFAAEMDKDGPYFSGREPMLVDFILAPFAIRNWVFDEFKGGLDIPAGGRGWVRWQKWVDAIEQRDSLRQTTSQKEKYLPIYER